MVSLGSRAQGGGLLWTEEAQDWLSYWWAERESPQVWIALFLTHFQAMLVSLFSLTELATGPPTGD